MPLTIGTACPGLAGHPGMAVREELDIAGEDDRDGFLDAAVALGQGGFGPGGDLVDGGPERLPGGVLEARGTCLFPTDLMYCYHCADLPIVCGTVVVPDHRGADDTSVVNLYLLAAAWPATRLRSVSVLSLDRLVPVASTLALALAAGDVPSFHARFLSCADVLSCSAPSVRIITVYCTETIL